MPLVRTLAVLLLCGVPALAQGRLDCAAYKSAVLKREVRFCASLPAAYDTDKVRRFPVVYYLHGLGENERALLPLWAIIGDLQQAGTVKQFLVITPDAGTSFYINSRDGRVRYEDFFIREFVPAMEKKYRIRGVREDRGIQGSSMGGYGALRFAFKYPQMFAAVAAEMPALYEKFPQRLIPYFEMSRRNVTESSPFGHPFNEAFWERNTPFALARENAARIRQDKLKIYFDVGSQDDYGFDEGVRQLDKLLTSLRIPHEAHVYPGGHNAAFVADHFGDAMKFVSDALGK
jgi:S-formylglutathione hydrolase FrmB